MTRTQLAILFFFQFAFILAFIRAVGYLVKQVGQPQVIGEMIAGVLMGPSLLGLIFPEWQASLFPKESVTILYVVSQLGLVLYMFVIGAEFDIELIRSRKRHAALVSITGIVAPFFLGGVLAYYLIGDDRLFGEKVTLTEAVLFMGSAMSVTALPMMARILYERGLTKTSMGTLALAASTIDDAAAWCMLAIVLASFSGDSSLAVLAIGGGVLYGFVVLLVIGPLLKRYVAPIIERKQEMSPGMFTFLMMLLMLGAWYTDYVGIYAVFGAFIIGIAMPRGRVTQELINKIHPLSSNILLPLFFIYSGLNTRFDLVLDSSILGIALIVLIAACLGKGVACWGAARLSGVGNKESLAIATLMNARGLMELILLNIGLERGMVTPTLFTVLVLMTLVTTVMVAPIFELIMRYMKDPVSVPANAAG